MPSATPTIRSAASVAGALRATAPSGAGRPTVQSVAPARVRSGMSSMECIEAAYASASRSCQLGRSTATSQVTMMANKPAAVAKAPSAPNSPKMSENRTTVAARIAAPTRSISSRVRGYGGKPTKLAYPGGTLATHGSLDGPWGRLPVPHR